MGAKVTNAPRLELRDPNGRIHFGYVVFLGACLLMFPQSLPINTASIFFVPVTQELEIPQSVFGLHTTIISLSICASTALVSMLFRRCNLKAFMACVIALEALCFFAYSLAQSVVVFYVASACIGASLAVLVYLVVPVLVNNWFSVRTSLLIGIGTCMQGIGGALFNTVGSAIIASYGWRTCYVVFGVVTLVIGIPASLVLLRRSPSELGLLPIGHGSAVVDEHPSLQGIAARRAYRTPCFALLVATCLCLSTAIFFNYYMSPYVISLGATIPQAGTASAAVMVGMCVGKVTVTCLCLSTAIFFNYYMSPYVISLGATIPQAGTASAAVMVGMCVGKVTVGALCDRSATVGVAAGIGAGIVGCVALAAFDAPNMGAICGACFLFGVAYASSSLLGAVLTRYGFGPRDFDRIWPTMGIVIALGNAFGAFFWGVVTENLGFTNGLLLDAVFMAAALGFGLACVRAGKQERKAWGLAGKEADGR